jgi:WD40 repeat protein
LFSSHDGNWLATGGTEGVLRLWQLNLAFENNSSTTMQSSLSSKQQQQVIRFVSEVTGHSKTINSVAFSNDDKQLVSVGDDGGIFVWCFFV